jgi:RNA polymerase sigma-70 factor (ECF subfamily)
MDDNAEGLNDLLQKACAGDRSSLESLLIHFHDPLLRFISRSMSPVAVAIAAPEDVLQETLIEAFRSIKTLQPRGRQQFFAWLKMIARTRLLNLIEARHAKKRGGERRRITHIAGSDGSATSILGHLAASDPTPSLIARQSEGVELIAAALAKLDPVRRQIMELRFGQGVPLSEIATITGKTEGAVKMMINRAIKELREELAVDFGQSSTGA